MCAKKILLKCKQMKKPSMFYNASFVFTGIVINSYFAQAPSLWLPPTSKKRSRGPAIQDIRLTIWCWSDPHQPQGEDWALWPQRKKTRIDCPHGHTFWFVSLDRWIYRDRSAFVLFSGMSSHLGSLWHKVGPKNSLFGYRLLFNQIALYTEGRWQCW